MVALPEDRAKSAEELAREAAEAEIAKRPPANHEDGQEEATAKPGAEVAGEDDAAPKEPPPFAADPRLGMGDRYAAERRKKREAEEKAPPQKAEGEAEAGADEGKDEGDGGLDVEAKEPPEKPKSEAKPAPAEDPEVELVVNGQRIRLPQSEVVAIARKNLAADDYLSQAKDILATAKRTARAAPDAESHGGEEGEAKPGTERGKPTQLTRERRLELFEAIQTGSPEEADAAFAELLTAVPSRDEVRATAEATVAQQEARTEANRALTNLAQEFPELAKDEELPTLVIQRTVSGMIKALEEAGAPEEHIAQIRGRPDWVRDYYFDARKLPEFRSLRSPADIAHDAAKAINDKYVVPRTRPQPKPEPGRAGRIEVSPEREARKADLPRQPRSASLRSAPGGKAEQSVMDKRRAAFQEVAARR